MTKNGDWVKVRGGSAARARRIQNLWCTDLRPTRRATLCRRPQQPGDPGVRRRRCVKAWIKIDVPFDENRQARDGNKPAQPKLICKPAALRAGAPWRSITPGPKQSALQLRFLPRAASTSSADGKVLGYSARGQQIKRSDGSRDGCHIGERALCRRDSWTWRVQK